MFPIAFATAVSPAKQGWLLLLQCFMIFLSEPIPEADWRFFMKHLTLSDRIRIEALLEECKSFSQIAAEIGKSPTTISREVLRHRSVVRHYSTEMARKRSECEHFASCTLKGLCGRV